MGCDGGTIPKRNEIVKNKKKDKTTDKESDRDAKWRFCALSGLQLRLPIVSCGYGRLYNKESVIEHLLESKTGSCQSNRKSVSHIKSLKDVKVLKLKEKSDYNKDYQATSGSEQSQAQFVCPISGLDFNGKYKFFYLFTCGCVISERALKEVPNEGKCILCSRSYDLDLDLITINGSQKDEDELFVKMTKRRDRQRETRKNGKRSDRSSSPQPSTSTATVKESFKKRKTSETIASA